MGTSFSTILLTRHKYGRPKQITSTHAIIGCVYTCMCIYIYIYIYISRCFLSSTIRSLWISFDTFRIVIAYPCAGGLPWQSKTQPVNSQRGDEPASKREPSEHVGAFVSLSSTRHWWVGLKHPPKPWQTAQRLALALRAPHPANSVRDAFSRATAPLGRASSLLIFHQVLPQKHWTGAC